MAWGSGLSSLYCMLPRLYTVGAQRCEGHGDPVTDNPLPHPQPLEPDDSALQTGAFPATG